MNIRPCIVVPIYNHGDAIGRTVTALVRYGLTIYVLDDGSDEPPQRRLAALAGREPLVRLLRSTRNEGKGAAVMRGLRQALKDGFTHALQIDADGQHDADDVPKFLAAGDASPLAVVCGEPVYDTCVPKARFYGRYITHVWVWIETLSFQIKDSICGYRLYPLALATRLIDKVRMPTRMDFDTAIAVRLVWAGAPVINVPTRVIYPRDGTSHFHMLRDNLRISWMHTGLVFGMLWRAPMLLWRKLSPTSASGSWARLGERGSELGILILFFTYRLLGRSVVRALLYPIVLYFFATGTAARAASRAYLQRLHAYAPDNAALPHAPTWRDSLHHMLVFAESSLDKMAAWFGRLDYSKVDFPNRAEILAQLDSGKGAMLIGAHLGSWEILRALAASTRECTVNAVVFTNHSRRYNHMLARANDRFALNLIQIATMGPETAISLHEKIERGELIVITGDRTPPSGNGRVVEATFLGHAAQFAQGPFLLAASLGCPVYLFFCLREDAGYRIYLEKFSDRIELPRRDREQALRGCVQRYAQRLESYCVRAPFQWFNFYDFWQSASASDPLNQEKQPRHDLDQTRTKQA